jgi:hypothetical protein
MATLQALMTTGRVVGVAKVLAAMAPTSASTDAMHHQARAMVQGAEGTLGGFAEFLANGGAGADATLGIGVDISALTLSAIVQLYERAKSPGIADGPANALLAPSSLHVVSFDALRRAQTTLQDFTNFYFSIHGLSHADFFRWLPVLVFAEACIYQLDEDNEHACLAQVAAQSPHCAVRTTPANAALRGVLLSRGLLSPRVVEELAAGVEYWALEQRLCASLASGTPLALEHVYRCSSLKSFVWTTGLEPDAGARRRSPPSNPPQARVRACIRRPRVRARARDGARRTTASSMPSSAS